MIFTVVTFTVGIWWLCVFLRQDFQESGWCLICPTVAWCLSWISIGAAFHPAVINPSYSGSGTGSIDARRTRRLEKRARLMSKRLTKQRQRSTRTRKIESRVSDSDEDVRGSFRRSGGFGKRNSSTPYQRSAGSLGDGRNYSSRRSRRQQIQELKDKLAESQRKRERQADLKRSYREKSWRPAGR